MRIAAAIVWTLWSFFGKFCRLHFQHISSSERFKAAFQHFSTCATLSLNRNFKLHSIIINSSLNDLIIALSSRNQFVKWFIESINSNVEMQQAKSTVGPCKEVNGAIGENKSRCRLDRKEKWREKSLSVANKLRLDASHNAKRNFFSRKAETWEN